MNTTYDVSIWGITKYSGKRKTTYYVRWKVGRGEFRESFNTRTLADSFRSELMSAARGGEPFDVETGLPASKVRKMAENSRSNKSWFSFAAEYVEVKWPDASPKHRQGIAEALTNATMALLCTQCTKPASMAALRRACRAMFSLHLRNQVTDGATDSAIRWLEQNTLPVADLATPEVLRAVMRAIESKLNGDPAAASTARRKRMTLHNILDYAVERKLLGRNPLADAKKSRKTQSSTLRQVDRRAVVSHIQARMLLAAVGEQQPTGPRLVAFFGLMYYAALRPEEAVALGKEHLSLPAATWSTETNRWEFPDGDGWAEIHLERAQPEVAAEWTTGNGSNEERGLKHRDSGETRTVPCPPELTALLLDHLARFGTAPDGRLFWSVRTGARIGSTVYGRAWAAARAAVFTPEVQASPLAKRPYDLRHAALSTWIMAGVELPRVAAWAGNSVAVLMRVYAKFIDGGEQVARDLVGQALRR